MASASAALLEGQKQSAVWWAVDREGAFVKELDFLQEHWKLKNRACVSSSQVCQVVGIFVELQMESFPFRLALLHGHKQGPVSILWENLQGSVFSSSVARFTLVPVIQG